MVDQGVKHPQVAWAETDGAVLMTIQLSDVVKPEIKVTEEGVSFKCTVGDSPYACDLKLKGKIDPEADDTQYTVTGRDVQFHLVKKEEERWNGLLENRKLGKNLVKPDWDKWVDSDDEEKDKEGFDMGQFGGQGAGGMPGMGGGGMPGMGGMGGMPGMGGMGGGGMPGMGGMGGMPGMEAMMGGMGGGAGGMGGMDMAKMAEMMKGMGGMPGAEGMGMEDGEGAEDEDDEDDLPELEAAE